MLARIKRERLQTEVEPSHPEVEIPYAVAEEVEDPLDSTNDVKLRVEFQAMPEPAPADGKPMDYNKKSHNPRVKQ